MALDLGISTPWDLWKLPHAEQRRRLADIADALALSPKTVSVYRARILEKMGMSNNAELTHYAIKHGLVD